MPIAVEASNIYHDEFVHLDTRSWPSMTWCGAVILNTVVILSTALILNTAVILSTALILSTVVILNLIEDPAASDYTPLGALP